MKPSAKKLKKSKKSSMTVEDVKERVTDVAHAAAADDALGHMEADQLLTDALQAIADGAPNAAELAREALKAEEIPFIRRFE